MKSAGTFLKMFVLSVFLFTTFCPDTSGHMFRIAGYPQEMTIRINPAFKVTRTSKGSVIVLARNSEGEQIKHEFTDFYADLILAAYRKQRLAYIESMLRKKYYLSEDDCRRELKHAINVLSEWNIILFGNKT